MKRIGVAFLVCAAALLGADAPEFEIQNQRVKAKLYLPDAEKGYYRGTRFDWSGAISSLEYAGHNFFGVWFPKYDPKLHDAITGPVEEFQTGESALGYDEAAVGGTFIRIGVGVLRKPEEKQFGRFKTYEIVDPGVWNVNARQDAVDFTHKLSDTASGYAYEYKKTVRLAAGEPQLIIEHALKNTGQKAIASNVYNHNFFVIDGQPSGPDFTVRFPFNLQPKGEIPELLRVNGKELTYAKEMAPGRSAIVELTGFDDVSDYDIRIENTKVGAGVRIRSDREMSKLMFWTPRTTLCPEPYIEMKIAPGEQFTWRLTYDFYTLPKKAP